MRIGVVSDTHDRHEMVAEAIRLLAEHQVELILHCGDIESVDTVRLFRDVPTHFVFGNWDRDRPRLAVAIREIGGTYYESFGALELRGKRIAWVHSHDRQQLRQLENADYFDFVFYGHTHLREQHRTGRTLVANPGALVRANPKTCIVLDLASGEIKPVIIPVPARAGSNGPAHLPSAGVDSPLGSAHPSPPPLPMGQRNPPPPATSPQPLAGSADATSTTPGD